MEGRPMVAATMSLRPKPLKKITYAGQRALDSDKTFLLKATDKLRTGTVRDIDQHCQLGKYEKFQYTVDAQVREWEEKDALSAAEDRRQLRETMLSRERQKRNDVTVATREMNLRWAQTQTIKRDRVKTDVQFEMAMQKVDTLMTVHHRQAATLDQRKGIEFYEKNLKKMGIGGDSDGVRLSISYEAPDLFEQRLRDTFHAKASTSEEIQSFVNQLKDRTAEKRAARYEKARRRRRALASDA